MVSSRESENSSTLEGSRLQLMRRVVRPREVGIAAQAQEGHCRMFGRTGGGGSHG